MSKNMSLVFGTSDALGMFALACTEIYIEQKNSI